MYEPILPQGDAAALMPGASYSVPGLFLYADLVYEALDQVKAKFDYDIPVKYIYGSPQVRWNCGRPVLIDHGYTDADLEAIVTHSSTNEAENTDGYKLDWFAIHTSNFTTATCTVSLKYGDEKFESVALGDGPVDAAFNAIDNIVNPVEHTFELYRINSVAQGKDTLGEVSVKLTAGNRTYSGRGLSTDILEASIVAYISAINKLQAATARIRV